MEREEHRADSKVTHEEELNKAQTGTEGKGQAELLIVGLHLTSALITTFSLQQKEKKQKLRKRERERNSKAKVQPRRGRKGGSSEKKVRDSSLKKKIQEIKLRKRNKKGETRL